VSTTVCQESTPTSSKYKASFGYCFDCGKYTKLHRHHLDGQHGKVEPDKVLYLCPACHRRRHSFPDGAPWTELLTDKQWITLTSLDKEKGQRLQEIKGRILALANRYIDELSEPIKKEHEEKFRRLLEEYGLVGISERFSLVSYPKPIWTLRFFRFMKPNKKGVL